METGHPRQHTSSRRVASHCNSFFFFGLPTLENHHKHSQEISYPKLTWLRAVKSSLSSKVAIRQQAYEPGPAFWNVVTHKVHPTDTERGLGLQGSRGPRSASSCRTQARPDKAMMCVSPSLLRRISASCYEPYRGLRVVLMLPLGQPHPEVSPAGTPILGSL